MHKRLRGGQVSPDPEDKYFYDDCERDGERESSVGPDESISRRFQPSNQSVSPSHSGAKLKHASAYSNLPNIINGSSWKERRSPNSTTIETIVNVTDIDVVHKAKSEKLPTIKPAPPAGYARTTASLIGWKQANKLETFGRHAKGYKSILKHFNWPMQGIVWPTVAPFSHKLLFFSLDISEYPNNFPYLFIFIQNIYVGDITKKGKDKKTHKNVKKHMKY